MLLKERGTNSSKTTYKFIHFIATVKSMNICEGGLQLFNWKRGKSSSLIQSKEFVHLDKERDTTISSLVAQAVLYLSPQVP